MNYIASLPVVHYVDTISKGDVLFSTSKEEKLTQAWINILKTTLAKGTKLECFDEIDFDIGSTAGYRKFDIGVSKISKDKYIIVLKELG